jgi:two-component system cell cycle response regulator DivK
MAGEPILIVDDTPVNLKLTRILLINEGYKVLTASTGEEALDLLRTVHPDLVLADIQLPGIDGLELTRRIKRGERTRDISVIALTANAMRGDEERAIAAGCDGYITKPIDTRTLGTRIREFVDRGAEVRIGPAPPPSDSPEASLPPEELRSLRARFLEEGQEQIRRWLRELDGDFKPNEAATIVHQWIGAAGLLGFTALVRLAREMEGTLWEKPVDQNRLRDAFAALAMAFSTPREARDTPVPERLRRMLCGVRVAIVDLPASEEQRLSVALERAEAVPVVLPSGEHPESPVALSCDAAAVHVSDDAATSPWLKTAVTERVPVVLLGRRDHLLNLELPVYARTHEVLMDGWQPEEAWVRLSLALERHGSTGSAPPPASLPLTHTRVVVADDDPTVVAVLRGTLLNFGMECETVANGPRALESVRRFRPAAAVLDVNMPGMDGFEVLSTIRAERLPVRVLLLTARQQEEDVLRGFALGADDYVVKPFSPLELVARLKRLLGS